MCPNRYGGCYKRKGDPIKLNRHSCQFVQGGRPYRKLKERSLSKPVKKDMGNDSDREKIPDKNNWRRYSRDTAVPIGINLRCKLILTRFKAVSVYSLTFSPSSPNPFSHPPSPYKRGEDRGCFAFVAREKRDRILLLPSPRRGRGAGGEGFSLS
ncbi:hypothetical protein MC7420_7042 [Coleofasciculus chthonoplastes PCC 7420]|uniref:Uncharacterized protein n=1 Tax=Coleofasciculus chthonoplastes PCC 7420 TaxID=118168 RepID=B4VI71_9CYAN|nr:hypothetical protein MC7420_7042 [Coleofasciculus chthonoplastes PCC 7420]